ncbi:MAG TPA: AzlC family ABC transporter permease [Candidatus Limnocylindrales bacterium]
MKPLPPNPSPDRKLLRDAGALAAAVGVIGISFGAIGVAEGMPAWAPIAMSLLVFAGGAQFLAVGLIGAGNPFAAILGGLLINARHVPFGLAIGSAISDRLGGRLLGAHLLTDESTAFTLAQPDGGRRRRTYWVVAGMLFAAWNIGTVTGVALGTAVGDPETYGLDAAFPAGLLALIMPALREPRTLAAAVAGAAIALATAPFLPAGLPVLLALMGTLIALKENR